MKKTSLLLVCVALALILVPFATNNQQTNAQDDPAVIRIGTLDLPTTLDPATADTFVEWEILSHLYVGLTRRVPNTTTVELAAAEEHTVSEDGLTHTFVLRDDLAFSDGSAITAETFVRSINRVTLLSEGGGDYVEAVLQTVEATDNRTLVFTLIEPVPYFLEIVSRAPFFAVHPDDFSQGEVRRSTEPLISNGPYLLESYVLNQSILLRPNPTYALGDAPRNGGVDLLHFSATETLRLAIEAGEVDVAWRDVRIVDAVSSADENPQINIERRPSTRMWYLAINLNDLFQEVNSDIALREVVARTIDRETLINDYFEGNVYPVDSVVPDIVGDAAVPFYTPFEDRETRGPILLEENGYTTSRPVQFNFISSRAAYGDYYVAVLTRLRTTLTPVNRYIQTSSNAGINAPNMVTALLEGTFQSAIFTWTPVAIHPDAYLRPLLHSEYDLPRNANYALAEVDVLLNQARRAQDVDEANRLYREAQQLMGETYTLLPLWQDGVHVLYREDITGITLEADYFLHYDLLAKQ